MTTGNRERMPARRSLRLEDWPDMDREAWEDLFRPGDILDGTVGAGVHWSPATVKNHRFGYGGWLMYLAASRLLDISLPPEDRITPERVRAYVMQLETEIGSWAVWGRLVALHAVIKAMAPEQDWQWLRRIVRHLERRRENNRDKSTRLRDATEIAAVAFARMDELRAETSMSLDALLAYRDALLVGLLIHCPTLRRRNLAQIEIGRHLQQLSQGYQLVFEPAETKTKKPLSIPIAYRLTPYIEHYLDEIRPRLLANEQNLHFWVTKYGDAMAASTIYGAIVRTTEQLLGIAINPHLFRDCAATTIAVRDPEHIAVASQLLGHVDLATTSQHYIQADSLSAGRRLRCSIDSLRADLAPRRRRHDGRRGEGS